MSRLAAVLFLLVTTATTPAQQLGVIKDTEAYAIYSEVVPRAWSADSPAEVVLQRETTVDAICEIGGLPDLEWNAAKDDLREQNAQPRLLQPLLSLGAPYRFISRSQIEADDARLALKYPGILQERPESIQFVAVSAVGFNSARTKAIVYVRGRRSGSVHFLERQNGRWVRPTIGSCRWIA